MHAPPGTAVPDSQQSRLPSLTGLRFVAAFVVLLSHTGYLFFAGASPDANFVYLAFTAGAIGLTFFFVLSGFVLTWVAQPGDTLGRFYRRRLVKIFPNHLVTLAATSVLMVSAGLVLTVGNVLPTALLVQAWIPSQEVIMGHGTNSPSWSLACELLFYAAFPLLLVLVRKIKPTQLWGWAWGVTAAIVALPFIAQVLPAEPTMWWGGSMSWWQYWFVYHFPVSRMLEFVLGILVAQIVLSGQWRRIRLDVAVVLTLLVFGVQAHLPDVFAWASFTALPLALVIASAATADVEGRRTVFGGRIMVWLGEISFALYIVHYLVIYYGPINAVDPEHGFRTWSFLEALRDVGLTIAISIVLAWVLYTFVETPAMRRWSRPAQPKKAKQVEQQPKVAASERS